MEIYKGLKFNYITVLDDNITKIDGIRYNYCRCECGKERYVNRTTLRERAIQDCGCKKFTIDKYLGKKYGKLTVVSVEIVRKTPKRTDTMCHCKCECGNESYVPAGALNAGKVKSCGCVHKFNFDKYKDKVYNGIKILEMYDKDKKQVICQCGCGNKFICGLFDITALTNPILNCGKCGTKPDNLFKVFRFKKPTRLLNTYCNMKKRCLNPNDKFYKHYGGRGIKVCDEWLESYKNFEKWALENGYKDNLTIERIDVNGNYEPSNCCWIPFNQQGNNTTRTKKYEYNGKLCLVKEIAKLTNTNYYILKSRLNAGWDLDRAINTPVKRRAIKDEKKEISQAT